MIVVMQEQASETLIQDVVAYLVANGIRVHRLNGLHTALGAIAPHAQAPVAARTATMPGVRDVLQVATPYELANRVCQPAGTFIPLGASMVGGGEVVVMAGPCSVESEAQIFALAAAVRKAGARVLRGGAFKPRTSPYSFQGLGAPGLQLLAAAAHQEGLSCVSEVMDVRQIDLVARHADILQLGARNMQNYVLLRELGALRKPVLLKRGASATIDEWLLAAEYVLAGGNTRVMLCERGIRSFDTHTRHTLDLSAIQTVKRLSHLPVIVDPSHGTGCRDQIAPMSRAAIAAGADGLLIEVHGDPDRALSDGAQSITPSQFAGLMDELRLIAAAVGRTMESHCEALAL
jgi:3-deoxy-7-phosphoheptulonate synthase